MSEGEVGDETRALLAEFNACWEEFIAWWEEFNAGPRALKAPSEGGKEKERREEAGGRRTKEQKNKRKDGWERRWMGGPWRDVREMKGREYDGRGTRPPCDWTYDRPSCEVSLHAHFTIHHWKRAYMST